VPQHGALLGAMAPHVGRFQRLIRHKIAIEHSYYRWNKEFPASHERWTVEHHRIPLITWEPWGATLREIIDGRHDDLIRAQARRARNFNRPFFLRFAHEMNGDWYPWAGARNGQSPDRYVRAWRHIHRIYTNAGATKVVWVWSPHWKSFPTDPWNNFRNYYPGDAYVDWVATGGYNHGSIGRWDWISFRRLFSAIYGEYAGRKPIMIAETASVERGGSKADWIRGVRRSMKEAFPAVRAFVWFHLRVTYEGYSFDWRVNSSRSALRAFRRLADDAYFNLDR
jgi:beta-mannanase